MARKKDLVHRLGDMLMLLADKYDIEGEDVLLYREVMDLLDELAKDDLFPPPDDWRDFTDN